MRNKWCAYQRLCCPKLVTCQYFTHDKYVSLASFTGHSIFQMMWLTNFQLADFLLMNVFIALKGSHFWFFICNSQTRWLAARRLADLQLAHYRDSFKITSIHWKYSKQFWRRIRTCFSSMFSWFLLTLHLIYWLAACPRSFIWRNDIFDVSLGVSTCSIALKSCCPRQTI